MKTVNIQALKTRLSQLVEEAAAGEEIVIAKAGKPVARLVALEPRTTRRKPGALKGRIRIGRDFDAPLPPNSFGAMKGTVRYCDDIVAPDLESWDEE